MHLEWQLKPKDSLDNGILALRFANNNSSGKVLFMKDSTCSVMTVSVLFFRFHDGLKLRMPQRQVLRIEKSAPNLNGLEFLFEVPDGCLSIVSIFLKYYKNERLKNTKAFSLGAICGVYVSPVIFPVHDEWQGRRSMLHLIQASVK